jgi:hypothetical protein
MEYKYKYKCLCCGNKENLIFGSFSKKSSMSYPKAFNEKRSIKHSLFYFLSNFLMKVGMRTLILKIKTFRSITDKKFLTFNNRDMTLNSVDGEFLRIIGKKRN